MFDERKKGGQGAGGVEIVVHGGFEFLGEFGEFGVELLVWFLGGGIVVGEFDPEIPNSFEGVLGLREQFRAEFDGGAVMGRKIKITDHLWVVL